MNKVKEYQEVEFLRDHFLAKFPELNDLGKHDYEKMMLRLQAKIEEFLERELSVPELDYLS